MICNIGDIVIIPFPFTDSESYKPRPAVVLSNNFWNKSHMHSLLAMITTACNTDWESDIKISNLEMSGLTTDSVIRFKLFTLDNRLIKSKIGELNDSDKAKVKEKLLQICL